MPDQDAPAGAEMRRQILGEIDRTMPTAGAADGHRQITAIVAHEARQPCFDVVAYVRKHAARVGVRLQERDHRRVFSGQGTQFRVVMGIGQATNVEHHVGIQRDAVLEAKGLEQQRQPGLPKVEQILHPGPQRVGIEVAGVDAMAEVIDVGEQFALALDALRKCAPLVRERMPAAGLREALDQRVGLGIEENQVQVGRASCRERVSRCV